MQDKLKEILKKTSIFTTDPDKDWKRLFGGLVCLTALALAWSVYFYIGIKQEIIDSESAGQKAGQMGTGEKEDELHSLVVKFEAKKQENDSVVSGTHLPAVLNLPDPAR
jgi:hypothetical protein